MLWRTRKALVNPSDGGSVMVLYGRSGSEGKTKLVQVLMRLIPDTIMWVNKVIFGT